ncbi:unnamed protein product [Closterium sp. NIES-64]|nr:unnamed protein product [Closterium sp. NIES-64]
MQDAAPSSPFPRPSPPPFFLFLLISSSPLPPMHEPEGGVQNAVQLPFFPFPSPPPSPLPSSPAYPSSPASPAYPSSPASPAFPLPSPPCMNLRVACKMLSKYGISTATASSGQRALQLLQPPHQFDLVFMDLQMPEMDGYETCRRGRQLEEQHKSPRVPIVALTADVLKGTKEKCSQAGMDGYITKPIDPNDLYTMMLRFFHARPS